MIRLANLEKKKTGHTKLGAPFSTWEPASCGGRRAALLPEPHKHVCRLHPVAGCLRTGSRSRGGGGSLSRAPGRKTAWGRQPLLAATAALGTGVPRGRSGGTAGRDGHLLRAGRGWHVRLSPCPSIWLPGFLYTDKVTCGLLSFPLGWGWGVSQGVNSCQALPLCCDSQFQMLCCGFSLLNLFTPRGREGAERQFLLHDSGATHSE